MFVPRLLALQLCLALRHISCAHVENQTLEQSLLQTHPWELDASLSLEVQPMDMSEFIAVFPLAEIRTALRAYVRDVPRERHMVEDLRNFNITERLEAAKEVSALKALIRFFKNKGVDVIELANQMRDAAVPDLLLETEDELPAKMHFYKALNEVFDRLNYFTLKQQLRQIYEQKLATDEQFRNLDQAMASYKFQEIKSSLRRWFGTLMVLYVRCGELAWNSTKNV